MPAHPTFDDNTFNARSLLQSDDAFRMITQEALKPHLATGEYAELPKTTICVCPDLLCSEESFYNRFDPLLLVEAKKYTCDIAFAV
jgi:hypothetical protein